MTYKGKIVLAIALGCILYGLLVHPHHADPGQMTYWNYTL